MTEKRWTALLLWAVAAVFSGAAVVSSVVVNQLVEPDGLVLMGIVLAFATTGMALVWRVPDNRIGWIYLAAGILGGLSVFGFIYGRTGVPQNWPAAVYAGLVWKTLYFPWIFTMVSLPILLFPDGEVPGPRWRFVYYTVLATILTSALGSAFLPGPLGEDDFGAAVNPIGIDALSNIATSVLWQILTFSLLIVTLLGPPLALIFRFLRSKDIERLQLKWLAYSASVAAVGLALTYLLDFYTGTWWLDIITFVGLLAVFAIPVTTGMAIVRYRLYDIDRLISRTVVYGLLVALLAGVFVGIVFLVGQLLPDSNSISVALSTLAVAALFNPLRVRIQVFIDRRLYRAQYDAREITEEFSSRLQDEVELDTLSDELLTVVDETVKPEAAGIWIRQPGDRS